ncbi:DUF1534 domain-containing protein [Pseudomonas caricapapayae]|nr:DUF1534 domain-containing protein [Pseudomonas caricapapayae]
MQARDRTRSIGTIVTKLSFLTLQRGNAVRDALRPIPAAMRNSSRAVDSQACRLNLFATQDDSLSYAR